MGIDWELWIDWGLGIEIRIGERELGLGNRILIGYWNSGLKLGLGLEIGILDLGIGSGTGIGDWD